MLLESRPEATRSQLRILRSKGVEGYVGPPLTQVRGWRGDQLMLQAGGRGEIWKVDGCLLVLESTQNNGGAPS